MGVDGQGHRPRTVAEQPQRDRVAALDAPQLVRLARRQRGQPAVDQVRGAGGKGTSSAKVGPAVRARCQGHPPRRRVEQRCLGGLRDPLALGQRVQVVHPVVEAGHLDAHHRHDGSGHRADRRRRPGGDARAGPPGCRRGRDGECARARPLEVADADDHPRGRSLASPPPSGRVACAAIRSHSGAGASPPTLDSIPATSWCSASSAAQRGHSSTCGHHDRLVGVHGVERVGAEQLGDLVVAHGCSHAGSPCTRTSEARMRAEPGSDTTLHRPLGLAEDLGDLPVGATLEVGQADGVALAVGQVGQHPVDLLGHGQVPGVALEVVARLARSARAAPRTRSGPTRSGGCRPPGCGPGRAGTCAARLVLRRSARARATGPGRRPG